MPIAIISIPVADPSAALAFYTGTMDFAVLRDEILPELARGGGPPAGWWRGRAAGRCARQRAPSTTLRVVPLPVPGRNYPATPIRLICRP